METPFMEVVRFETDDILTQSWGVVLGHIWDDVNKKLICPNGNDWALWHFYSYTGHETEDEKVYGDSYCSDGTVMKNVPWDGDFFPDGTHLPHTWFYLEGNFNICGNGQ